MEGMCLKFTPVLARCLLGRRHIWAYGCTLFGLIASPNSPNRGYNPLPTAFCQPPPTSLTTLYMPLMIL